VNPRILYQNNGTAYPVISIIVWKEDASLLAMINLLHSSMNQKLFEKNLCNQSSHYENNGWFLLRMEVITCLPQNLYFSWWAKMNETQSGKSMKNEQERHFSDWSNIEQQKNQACSLSHCRVMLVWSQSVSQSVLHPVHALRVLCTVSQSVSQSVSH